MTAAVHDAWAFPAPSPRSRERAAARRAVAPAVVGVTSVAARVYLTVLAGLLFWSLVPMLFGLTPVVVRTGSMQPAIRPGDVVLVQHVNPASVQPGQVVLAADPAHPGRLLSHRVVRRNPDGTLVTRGDANRTADSTPLQPAQVKGVARLRVPFIGRPAVWWWQGERRDVAGWLLLSVVAVLLVGAPTAAPRGRHRLVDAPRTALPSVTG